MDAWPRDAPRVGLPTSSDEPMTLVLCHTLVSHRRTKPNLWGCQNSRKHRKNQQYQQAIRWKTGFENWSDGGEGGIRTHETLASPHAFQACAFSHSATSPSTPTITGTSSSASEQFNLSAVLPQFRRVSRRATACGAPDYWPKILMAVFSLAVMVFFAAICWPMTFQMGGPLVPRLTLAQPATT
jgi:hypothetical protein